MKKESGNEIFGRGLIDLSTNEESKRLFQMAVSNAFSTVFRLSNNGELRWRRLKKRDGFKSLVLVKNALGEDVEISVFLIFHNGRGAADVDLILGGKNQSPCRNNHDQLVRRLIREVNASTEKEASVSGV